MKTRFLLLLGLSVILGACGAEDEVLSPIWGIDFSTENAAGFAVGSVEQFKGETKTTYIIKSAELRGVGGDVYTIYYAFESGDAMEIRIAKRAFDDNYFFPGRSGENQLLSATLNGEILSLTEESKVSVQPRTDENKLATLAKLQTSNMGLFDGSIGRVPLLK